MITLLLLLMPNEEFLDRTKQQLEVLKKQKEQCLAQLALIDQQINSLNKFLSLTNPTQNTADTLSTKMKRDLPQTYSACKSWRDKILYVLAENGQPMSVEEITRAISSKGQGEADGHFAQYCSNMEKAGLLKAQKEPGVKKKYSLID